jgi:hypothetical protein
MKKRVLMYKEYATWCHILVVNRTHRIMNALRQGWNIILTSHSYWSDKIFLEIHFSTNISPRCGD